MANRIPSKDFLFDLPSADCLSSDVTNFHKIYVMPSKQLKLSKSFHERVLDKCFRHLGFCTDMKQIGDSYGGVKVVKSEADDFCEFNVMFVLKMPMECHLEIMEIPGRHGYAMLKVANGCRDTPDYYNATDHKFFARCLTFENDMCIVDAGKTAAAFFGELQKWTTTKPGYNLLSKQHGTEIQMDVTEQKRKYNISYSVGIEPTIEILDGDCVRRYVVKPEQKRTPDSITWRRLFDSGESASGPEQLFRRILQSAVGELDKQLFEYCSSCKGVCQGSCLTPEAARTRIPLPTGYVLKLQAAFVAWQSSYRLAFVNLQELNSSKNKRLVAINYFLGTQLEAMPVPEKPGYAWLKYGEEASGCSHFNKALKFCYLPGGKYLDLKAACDMFVVVLQAIANDVFSEEDTVVGRDGPVVRIDLYPKKRITGKGYSMDIVLAAYVDSNFYVGLSHDYDDVPDHRAWRRSYSYEETKKIQQAPEGLKMVLRVLKALRNGERSLAQLTSYHFITLLLNMQQLTNVNWNEAIDKLLIRSLQHLKICLTTNTLQTHFIPEINLFENMTNDCIINVEKRIDELLRKRRGMFKALNIPTDEPTRDILKGHDIERAQMFHEKWFTSSSGSVERDLLHEIDKRLLGYDRETFTRKPVYDDINVYKIFQNEIQGLTNCSALMFIHSINNLRALRYGPEVVLPEGSNSTVGTSLLQTVPHNYDSVDTRKTAEYIKQQLETLIDKYSYLREGVHLSVHLEGSRIVLKTGLKAVLNIVPGYEVAKGFFVAMPGEAHTNAWVRIPFSPVMNKFWKAF